MNHNAAPTSSRNSAARLLRSGALLLAALVLGMIGTCSPRSSGVDEIRKTGLLRVATINSPTVYYIGPGGEAVGLEYDLVKALADRLGVRVQLDVAATPGEALAMVRSGRDHMAAASVLVTPERQRQLRFSKPLLQVVPQLVYRNGSDAPKNLGELQGTLRIPRQSALQEYLQQLKTQQYPQLRWETSDEDSGEELLFQVAEGKLDYTIVNSDLLAINLRYYPKLRAGIDIAAPQDIAWAFPDSGDDSLLREADRMLEELGGAELARIKDRYLGHIEQVDTYGAQTLATHAETRLPQYRSGFEKAAAKYGLDWRLLAAIAYQESHWDTSAVSPTGVRGIMQLTNSTAELMKLENREDPQQSIMGGARFFRLMLNQLPPGVTEPDRSWMALAAYNMGIGHLLDARDLARKRGGDANRWLDVRNALPLLSKEQWYSKTRHGYARSLQTITYVGNVRTYYDMLVWLTGDRSTPQPQEDADADTGSAAPAVSDKPVNPLNINSPVL